MATTAIKLKIAKTKPATHKILPVEYRRAHFWDSSATSVFQTAIPPLFTAFFWGTKSTGAKKPFLCHFFTAVSSGAGNRESQLLSLDANPCRYITAGIQRKNGGPERTQGSQDGMDWEKLIAAGAVRFQRILDIRFQHPASRAAGSRQRQFDQSRLNRASNCGRVTPHSK